MGETSRMTRNGGWARHTGPVSSKLEGAALELKALIQRGMNASEVEEANRQCDAILQETERVGDMETRLPVILFVECGKNATSPMGKLN